MPDFATDSVELVEALIAKAERASVKFACLPHLRAVHHELTTETPATGLDPDIHAAWRMMFSGAMAMMPVLIATALVHPDSDHVYRALLVLVEGITRSEADTHDNVMRVLNGVREPDDVVGDMIAAAHARDQAAIATAAQVAHDPALVAEIDAADRLDAGAFSVPLPLSARPGPDTYFVRATLDHLSAFYTCWAQRNGWLYEMVLDNDRFKAISLRRETHTFDIRITTWIMGENAVSFSWPAGMTATLVVNAVPAPTLPAVTRARASGTSVQGPIDDIDALLADGGLVFAAKDHAVWLIDPVARTRTLVAEMMRGTEPISARGLAADGRDILVRTNAPTGIWRLDPVAGSRTQIDIALAGYIRTSAYRDGTCYFAHDDRLVAVVLSTGASTELGRFADTRALCAAGGVLYVAADRAVHAIDLATGTARQLATVPKAALGLASDGTGVYTLHGGGIGRIDLATSTWAQIAGMPDLGAGNYLAIDKDKPPPDGIAERAIIDSASHISYDGGGLWFSERTRLRRLAIAERQVTTLQL